VIHPLVRPTSLALLLAACGSSDQPPEPAVPPEIPPEATPPAEAPAEAAAEAGEAPAEVEAAAGPTTLALDTTEGALQITPVYHGTVRLQLGDAVIWIDPWSKADLAEAPTADVVLITDNHFDHLDEEALPKVLGAGTKIVGPKAVADQIKAAPVDHVLANGESVTIGPFAVTAVPMYNLHRGPEEGQLFHDKGRGNGYLVAVGGKTLYVAGDTACTDEMKALTGVDHALVPMNLPYTMTPEEAAECVNAFKPVKVTPYHYAGSDLAVFAAAVTDSEVVEVDAYPGGLPW